MQMTVVLHSCHSWRRPCNHWISGSVGYIFALNVEKKRNIFPSENVRYKRYVRNFHLNTFLKLNPSVPAWINNPAIQPITSHINSAAMAMFSKIYFSKSTLDVCHFKYSLKKCVNLQLTCKKMYQYIRH
jgi:hypothetical protein